MGLADRCSGDAVLVVLASRFIVSTDAPPDVIPLRTYAPCAPYTLRSTSTHPTHPTHPMHPWHQHPRHLEHPGT